MRTLDPPLVRRLVLLLMWLVASGCGRILGIEGAHVDPILDDDQTQTTDQSDDSDDDDSDDDNDTVALHTRDASRPDDDDDTRPDANGAVDVSDDSNDTAAECIAFDNRRVRLLNTDGTLTPLPERDTAVR